MAKIKWPVVFLLSVLLIYTRFVNLSWGLPYPFHPDERNMAVAIQSLNCEIRNSKFEIQNCFNPHFFAYGQLPLYLGYGLVYILKFVDGDLNTQIGFQETVISLRLISAFASVLTVLFAYQILKKVFEVKNRAFLLLPFIFSPALIQFAHFGTTESLSMLFFIWIIYESLLFINKKISIKHFVSISGLLSGLAVATKISSVIFVAVPLFILLLQLKSHRGGVISLIKFLVLTIIISVIFSPHNMISFNDFVGTIRYESNVALGTIKVFYTRQFEKTVPIFFHFTKIFPDALGFPVLLFFLIGFFILPYSKEYNVLRLAFLVYFLPTSFLFTKWTRFVAPVMPLMVVVASLTLVSFYNWCLNTINNKLKVKNEKLKIQFESKKFLVFSCYLSFLVISFSFAIPGIAFLSVYTNPDVRLTASSWINKNIPSDSYILSETANVVDIPVTNPNNYNVIPFNFYNLDEDPKLQKEFNDHLAKADYIFVPSRRVFANHTKKRYPLVNKYYNNLFSNRLGFKKVAEFSSYPRISLFGKTLLEFPDEGAEETFTVFDHPVIRIYKKS